MRNLIILTAAILFLMPARISAQDIDNADLYILTCSPGRESYSVYGHTALRITFSDTGFDMVYNWGIFDFETPNFVYRFAKGKLDYLLGAYSYERFLAEYEYEQRTVWSQQLYLTSAEKERLFRLLNENLRPENISYRYDFFHDNCATRVYDIVAASVTDSIVLPVRDKASTFRQLIDPFQKVLPWLDLGADMLLGLPADRKASVRDEMFLPIHLKENMAATAIMRDDMAMPLCGPVITVIETPDPPGGTPAWVPQAVLWALFLAVLLFTILVKNKKAEKAVDILLFLIYSLIALLLLFTNLISDHAATHFNLFFQGVNLLIPVLFLMIIANRRGATLFRLALLISASWLPVSIIAGQGVNPALVPVVLIIMARIFRHCSFGKSL